MSSIPGRARNNDTTFYLVALAAPSGATLPATGDVGDMFIKTDATGSAALYVCLTANVWTQQTGTGGGGGVTNPITLVSSDGSATLTLNASGGYSVTVGSNHSMAFAVGQDGMLGMNRPGAFRVPIESFPNGRAWNENWDVYGRHSAQVAPDPSPVMVACGAFIQGHADDSNPAKLFYGGQNAYAQATVNTSGGDVMFAPGLGRRLFTVTDYTALSGKSVTITVNGVATTKTEGVHWTAGTSNTATATSLGNAIASIPGLLKVNSGNTVYITPYYTTVTQGPVYGLTLATNAASGLTVTQGADGVVQTATVAVPATNPAAFTATHMLLEKDGLGNLYWRPVSSDPW
jgi:hypothetical protein